MRNLAVGITIKGIPALIIKIHPIFHVGLSGSRYGIEATVQLRRPIGGSGILPLLIPVRIPIRRFTKEELISFITKEAEKELEILQGRKHPGAIDYHDTAVVRELAEKLNDLLGLEC